MCVAHYSLNTIFESLTLHCYIGTTDDPGPAHCCGAAPCQTLDYSRNNPVLTQEIAAFHRKTGMARRF
jgi:hypothetical protein